MYKFSEKSRGHLVCCHPDLQIIMNHAIKFVDFSVICGHRNEREQTEAYNKGTSKLKWPKSKHNKFPSEAIDIVPYPTGYGDEKQFYILSGVLKVVIKQLKNACVIGNKIRWGGDWDSDGDLNDQNFDDLAHYEIL
jgi:peptidoglycan L-alanyl-D-glutamate endopeptidase CwlK